MSQSAAVLVIDMANDFVYPGGTIADAGGPEYQKRAQAIIPRLARLLVAARSAGIAVIYATDAHTPRDKELRRGYDLVWVTDALQAFTDEAHKAGLGYFEAWYATDPKSQLKTVDELVEDWAQVLV